MCQHHQPNTDALPLFCSGTQQRPQIYKYPLLQHLFLDQLLENTLPETQKTYNNMFITEVGNAQNSLKIDHGLK